MMVRVVYTLFVVSFFRVGVPEELAEEAEAAHTAGSWLLLPFPFSSPLPFSFPTRSVSSEFSICLLAQS